jgi:hypothetical protein
VALKRPRSILFPLWKKDFNRWDFRFSQRQLWRWLSSGMLRRVMWWVLIDVSDMLTSYSIIALMVDYTAQHAWRQPPTRPDYYFKETCRLHEYVMHIIPRSALVNCFWKKTVGICKRKNYKIIITRSKQMHRAWVSIWTIFQFCSKSDNSSEHFTWYGSWGCKVSVFCSFGHLFPGTAGVCLQVHTVLQTRNTDTDTSHDNLHALLCASGAQIGSSSANICVNEKCLL